MNTVNETIICHFAKVVAHAEKKSKEMQYDIGIKMLQNNYHKKLAELAVAKKFCEKNGFSTSENLFEIVNICRAMQDILMGKPTGYLAKIDTKQSGMTLQACITRCKTSLENLGYLSNENRDFYMMFCNLMKGMNREQMKDLVLPHFYGAVAEIIKKLGREKAEEFFRAYAQAVPKPDALRQAFIDCWDESATDYWWNTPDHCQIHIVVKEEFSSGLWDEETGEKLYSGSETTRIEWKNSKDERKSCFCYYPKKGTLMVGDYGYKSLGANAIQATDGYAMRELGIRCRYANAFRAKFATLRKGHSFIGFENAEQANKTLDMYKCWQEMDICSLRVMFFIPEGAVIPEDYYNAIATAICNLPKHDFRVMAVHDEFMCHFNYLNEMQKAFNLIVTEIYKGNMLNYWSNVFNWDKYGINIDLDPVNTEIAKCLANSDYMLQ